MSPLTLSYGLILATIYLFISRTLFIRRKSESAGQATAGRRLQSTIRIAIGFPLCLFPLNEIYNVIIGNSTNGPAIFSCFLFYIIAILAMFIYELISTKKASELKRVFPSIASLFVLNVLCLGVIYVLFQSQLRYNPDPSDIKYVQIMQNEYDYYDNNYFNKRANDFKIQDENIIKLLSKSLTETLDYEKNGYPHGQQYDVLVVGIRSGYSTKNRRLYLSSDVYSEVMNYLMTCKEIQNIYTDLPDYNSSDIVISTELQSEDSIALYKSLQQEVKTIDPTVWYNEVRNLNCSIALYCNVNYDDSQMYMQLPLTTLTPKTLLLYLQYSNKLVSTEN